MTPVGDWGCGLFDLKRKKHLRWFHWNKFEKIRVVFPSFFFCGGRLMRLMLNKN